MSRLLDRLSEGPPIVADGGMGVLVSSAVTRLRCPEEANLRSPESVLSLHLGFIRAGADLIETNTFGANRHKLAAQYLEEDVARINEAAVKIARDAREVSGRDVLIAGSIGPLGGPAKDRDAVFAEQAQLLEGRGVDLFMVETFYELEELVAAIGAVRSVSSLPIVAVMTFDEDAETLGGVTAEQAAAALAELDVAAVGANHGVGLQAALRAIERMGGSGKPLAVLPNVGLASLAGERVVFPHATPEYFAEFAAHAQELGARIIGGCCGTTPTEIAAIRAAVDEHRRPSAPLVVRERELALAAPAPEQATLLQRKLDAGEFVVSVEIDPPRGGNAQAMLELAHTLQSSGHVDVVDVNDNPRARARMSGIMASATIERVVGIETIPAPHPARLLDRRPRVHAARRPCRRHPERPRGHRRPARGRRLPGRSRRVRGRLDRPLADHQPHERRRGLQRPRDRRADVVLPRRRGQPRRGRPRLRARAVRAEARGRSAVRDDAGALRPLVPRCVPRAARRLVPDPAPRRGLLRPQLPAGACGCTTRCRASSSRSTCRHDSATPGSDAAAVGLALAKELVEASREQAAGVYVIPPFRQPLAALDLFS